MTEAAAASSTALRFGAGSLLVSLCLALGVTAATQIPAGARSPAPDKTIPTLPPASDDVPVTAAETTIPETTATPSTEPPSPASTEPPPASTEPAGDTGIPLPAGAGPSILFAAASNALRSNDDVTAGLGGFAVIPAGIPTPAGATIERIAVSYSAEPESYVATAAFSTPATVDDVTAYYATVLTARGFVPRRGQSESGVRELEFDRADAELAGAGVTVRIEGAGGAEVELEVTDHADPAALEAFAGWPAGLPGIDDGRPVGAAVTATSDGGTTVVLSTTFVFDGVSADELTARIRDGLASGGGGFRIADADEGGATIALEHAVIDDVIATISDVEGAAQLVIDGTVD